MRRQLAVVAIGLPLLIGCSTADTPEPAHVVVRDSVGVQIVEIDDFRRIAAPEWRLDEVYRTSRTGVELFDVGAARIGADGHLLIGNHGTKQILMLDRLGELVRVLGREGDGPGEFRAITSIHVLGDGTFTVYDTRQGRWSHFDSSGILRSTEPMPPPNPGVDLEPLLRTAEGSSLAIYGSMRRFAEDGIRRDTTPLLRYRSSEVTPDTLSLWAGLEWSYTRSVDRASRTYVGFARSLAAFGNTRWCVLGDTDAPVIYQLDETGSLVRLVKSTRAAMVVTEAEGAEWRRRNVGLLGESAPEELRQRFAQAPYNETYPAFDAVSVEPDGALWVGLTARLVDRERRWVIFGVTGDPVGRVDLPVDAEILDIRDDWLALLRTDDLDVEEIALYRVTRS